MDLTEFVIAKLKEIKLEAKRGVLEHHIENDRSEDFDTAFENILREYANTRVYPLKTE